MFPLGTVLVPGMPLALQIFEPRYRQMMADLLAGTTAAGPIFGVVALRAGWEVGTLGDVHEIGTTARATDVRARTDGRYELDAVGERRFVIESLDTTSEPYLQASVRYLPEPDGDLQDRTSVTARLAWREHLLAIESLGRLEDVEAVELGLDADDEVGLEPSSEDSVPLIAGRALSYTIAQLPTLPMPDRQRLLAVPDTAARLAEATRVLRRETTLVRRLHAVPATAASFRLPISAS